MKPIHLKMTAFGPYKDKETIDFTELDKHKLYVISGATGAGKTTIFDGICFALFGVASGSDRDNTSMLRSHFAEDHVHTSVEFVFELNGKTYRVLRQLGHIKKGNKTKTGERYEFFEIIDEHEEIPCVDRQIVSEINEKIESLIGLTPDQFKQIVMLPQGEFRKLLTSDTENKEEILRRLFQTERYQRMNTVLKRKKEMIQQQFFSEKQMLDHYINSIYSSLEHREDAVVFKVLSQETYNTDQIIDSLEEEITYLNEKIVEDEKNYQHSLRQYEKTQKLYHHSLAINEQFMLLDTKSSELKQLYNQREKYLQKEKQLEAAERANQIEPYEKHVMERQEEVCIKEQQMKETEKKLSEAKKILNVVQEAYKNEENKGEQREKLTRDIDRFHEFLPVVNEMEQTKDYIDRLQHSIQEKVEKLNIVVKDIEDKTELVQQLKQKVNEQDEVVSNLGIKQIKRNELAIQYKLFHKYTLMKQQQFLLQEKIATTKQMFNEAEKFFKRSESIWLHNQAAMLASNLENGDACPVCGNTQHPNKAKIDHQVITKEELDIQKNEFEKKQEEYHMVKAEYTSLCSQLESMEQEINVYQVPFNQIEQELKEITLKGKKLKEEIDEIEQISRQLKSSKENVNQLEKEMKENLLIKEKLEKQLMKEKTSITSMKATLKERTRRIPADIQNIHSLQDRINQMKTLKAKLDTQWKEIGERLKQAEQTYTMSQVNVINGKKQVQEAQASLKKSETIFQSQLQGANFKTREEYDKAKMTIDHRKVLRKEIEQYKQQTISLQKQVEELTKELKQKERINIKIVEEKLIELKNMYESALKQVNQSKKNHSTVNNLKENIMKVQLNIQKLESELAIVIDLYDTLRGQNMKKISFERYLQIDYLDQITLAANERFKTLSDGQYYFIRSDRQEAYGKQSGLAIDVYDSYTGQTRDVKTLSGGEKFIASLSLALGMSDVIQGFQGGVSIETMFIDEGFGSLDEESLNKSIDALVHLQKTGRTIGVISHVKELINIFPALLEVKKTKEGYSKTRFIIK